MSTVGQNLLLDSGKARKLLSKCIVIMHALMATVNNNFLVDPEERKVAISRALKHVNGSLDQLGIFMTIELQNGNDTNLHQYWDATLKYEGYGYTQLNDLDLCGAATNSTSQYHDGDDDEKVWLRLYLMFTMFPFPVLVIGLVWLLIKLLLASNDLIFEHSCTIIKNKDFMSTVRSNLDKCSTASVELSKLFYTYDQLCATRARSGSSPTPEGTSSLMTMLSSALRQLEHVARERDTAMQLYKQTQVLSLILNANGATAEERLRNAAFLDFTFPESNSCKLKRELGFLIPLGYEFDEHDAEGFVRAFFPNTNPNGKYHFQQDLYEKEGKPLGTLPLGTDGHDLSRDSSVMASTEQISLFSLSEEQLLSESVKQLSVFTALWMPPPVTPLMADDVPRIRIHAELNNTLSSYTVLTRMAEKNNPEGSNRLSLDFCQRAMPLMWGSLIRVVPGHWESIRPSVAARRILASLRATYTTDQNVTCKHLHVCDTVCRSCRSRVLCAFFCKYCSLAVQMSLEPLRREGEYLPETPEMLHDVLYHQLIFLSTGPSRIYVTYPFQRLLHCLADRSSVNVRTKDELISDSAVRLYNCRRYCNRCKEYHELSEQKREADIFPNSEVNDDLLYANCVDDGRLVVGVEELEPLDHCPETHGLHENEDKSKSDFNFAALLDEANRLDEERQQLISKGPPTSLIAPSTNGSLIRGQSLQMAIASSSLINSETHSPEEKSFYKTELERLIGETLREPTE